MDKLGDQVAVSRDVILKHVGIAMRMKGTEVGMVCVYCVYCVALLCLSFIMIVCVTCLFSFSSRWSRTESYIILMRETGRDLISAGKRRRIKEKPGSSEA